MTDDGSSLINEQGSILKRHWAGITLVLILILAGFLRFIYFGESPPGINQDEAVDAWNAYCLLKTGKDQVGASWPIFYMRGIGSSWSTLYIYLLIPFQAIGGLSITTTRIPPALFGVVGIAVMYYAGQTTIQRKSRAVGGVTSDIKSVAFPGEPMGARKHYRGDVGTGAAGFDAVGQYHTGGESHAQANRGGDSGNDKRNRLLRLSAGEGICADFSVSDFYIESACVAAEMKKPKFLIAVIIFSAGFMAFFGPLAWQHIFHPHEINRHFYFQPERTLEQLVCMNP